MNWQKARQQCKSYGKHWDLAIFNYDREFTRIQQILKDNCVADHAYWIGKGSTDLTDWPFRMVSPDKTVFGSLK